MLHQEFQELLADDAAKALMALQTLLRQLLDSPSVTPTSGRRRSNAGLSSAAQWLQAFGALKEQAASEDQWMDVKSNLVDVLWLFNLQFVEGKQETHVERLREFTVALLETEWMERSLLLERLDPEFMEAVGLIHSQITWTRKLARMNTAMLYRQQKFNLLREESEGYAKLITEVEAHLGGAAAQPTPAHLQTFQNLLHSLIGVFDLDPNRVLDLLLDLFAENVREHAEFFLAIFKASAWKQSVYAGLMGFKFTYYANGQRAPRNLYDAAATLIQHGLLTLEALYPHLSPADIEISAAYEKFVIKCKQEAKQADKVTLGGTSANKNASAGNGGDVDNQKARLCAALLSVGEFDHAMVILKKFPKLCALEPRLVPLFCSHLHRMIEPVYAELRIKDALVRSGGDVENSPDTDAPSNFLRSKPANQPPCQTLDEIVERVLPLLEFVGPRIYHDVYFVTKLCRLARSAPDSDSPVWIQVLLSYILPTLSLTRANIGLSNEIWLWISAFPYEKRYTIYGAWKSREYDSTPEMIIARSTAVKETKRILRRIAKENVKQFGRALGKLSHSNPTICLATILDQLQVYENMITPVVDCLRYLSEMSFDVLSYIMLEDLANPLKSRLKSDGTNLSLWLNCLGVFAGTLFRRYPAELTGLLNYVFLQVKDGNPFDLVVIKELVTKMSGAEQLLEGASEQQLEAMAGGETLKREAMQFGQQKNTARSSQRLGKALLGAHLAIEFAILIGKQRSSCIYHTEIGHLKLLSSLYDQVQETFNHYSEFIANHLDPKQYIEITPSFLDLVQKYSLEQEVCWALLRPKIAMEMKMKTIPDAMDLDNGEGKSADEAESESEESMQVDGETQKVVATWNPYLQKYIEQAERFFDPAVLQFISPHFYVSFWQLSIYDIYIPLERYQAETQKQNLLLAEMEKSTEDASKKKREKERIQHVIKKLEQELAVQQANYKTTNVRLEKEQAHWFVGCSNRYEIISHVIQYCIRPRALFSASDAMFSARFVFKMHALGTVNFSSLSLLDRLFGDVNCTVFTCTQNEAMYYGRFLNEIIAILHRWHKNPDVFEKEARGENLPGFRKRWSTQPNANSSEPTSDEMLSYEDFRHVFYKWHVRMFKAFLECLESKEYMKMRNAIIVLDKISEYFPAVKQIGAHIDRKMRKVMEEESREDLKVLLNRYDATLQKNKSRWISVEEFHHVASPEAPKKERVAEEQPATPEKVAAESKVDPKVETKTETKTESKSEKQETSPASKSSNGRAREASKANERDTQPERLRSSRSSVADRLERPSSIKDDRPASLSLRETTPPRRNADRRMEEPEDGERRSEPGDSLSKRSSMHSLHEEGPSKRRKTESEERRPDSRGTDRDREPRRVIDSYRGDDRVAPASRDRMDRPPAPPLPERTRERDSRDARDARDREMMRRQQEEERDRRGRAEPPRRDPPPPEPARAREPRVRINRNVASETINSILRPERGNEDPISRRAPPLLSPPNVSRNPGPPPPPRNGGPLPPPPGPPPPSRRELEDRRGNNYSGSGNDDRRQPPPSVNGRGGSERRRRR